jgi:hypothetical protein
MKKIIWIVGLVLCVAAPASAQSRGDNPSMEVFGGPSILRNGATAPHFSLFGGWQAQADYNFARLIGITADFGGQYRSISGVHVQQYEYMFGPRVMLRSRRATLFAHGLVGGNTFRVASTSSSPSASRNGFAAGVGGGLDYNVGFHLAIRVIQADYLRTRLTNQWFHDARLGMGIVIKF